MPVGAVYDRAFFLESTKYARSQTAPTEEQALLGQALKPYVNSKTRGVTDTRPYSGALNHNDADVVRKFGEIKRAPFNCFVNLSCALMLDGAKSVFEI